MANGASGSSARGPRLPCRASWRAVWALTALSILTHCATVPSRLLVLNYADFGPQAMAYQLIGQKRLSWDRSAPIGLGLGQVRVVVYAAPATEATARKAYPPDPIATIDYRYVSRTDAEQYLEQQIQMDRLVRVTERLGQTLARIRTAL